MSWIGRRVSEVGGYRLIAFDRSTTRAGTASGSSAHGLPDDESEVSQIDERDEPAAAGEEEASVATTTPSTRTVGRPPRIVLGDEERLFRLGFKPLFDINKYHKTVWDKRLYKLSTKYRNSTIPQSEATLAPHRQMIAVTETKLFTSTIVQEFYAAEPNVRQVKKHELLSIMQSNARAQAAHTAEHEESLSDGDFDALFGEEGDSDEGGEPPVRAVNSDVFLTSKGFYDVDPPLLAFENHPAREEYPIHDIRNPYCPYRAFQRETALTYFCQSLEKRQKDLTSYYDLDNATDALTPHENSSDETAADSYLEQLHRTRDNAAFRLIHWRQAAARPSAFHGFPYPRTVFAMQLELLNPELLHSIPLPFALGTVMNPETGVSSFFATVAPVQLRPHLLESAVPVLENVIQDFHKPDLTSTRRRELQDLLIQLQEAVSARLKPRVQAWLTTIMQTAKEKLKEETYTTKVDTAIFSIKDYELNNRSDRPFNWTRLANHTLSRSGARSVRVQTVDSSSAHARPHRAPMSVPSNFVDRIVREHRMDTEDPNAECWLGNPGAQLDLAVRLRIQDKKIFAVFDRKFQEDIAKGATDFRSYDEYREKRWELTMTLADAAWREVCECAFANDNDVRSQQISRPIRSVILYYYSLPPEKRVIYNGLHVDARPFTAMVVQIISFLSRTHRVTSLYAQALLLFFVILDHCHWKEKVEDPQLNAIFCGDGDGGKTYLLLLGKKVLAPGVMSELSFQSAKNLVTDTNFDDRWTVFNELPPQLVTTGNVAEGGNPGAAIFKEVLTRAEATAERNHIDKDGNAKSKFSYASMRNTFAGASNMSRTAMDPHLLTRFLVLEIETARKAQTEGQNAADQAKSRYFVSDKKDAEESARFQLVHCLYFFQEYLRRMYVFGGVDVNELGGTVVAYRILDHASHEFGLNMASVRKRTFVTDLARNMSLYYYVWLMNTTKMKHIFCPTRESCAPFPVQRTEREAAEQIRKYGQVEWSVADAVYTQAMCFVGKEQVILSLSLLSNVFDSKSDNAILYAAAIDCGNLLQGPNDQMVKFGRRILTGEEARVYRLDHPEQFGDEGGHGNSRSGGGEIEIQDYTYIRIEGDASYQSIRSKIVSAMASKNKKALSVQAVRDMLTSMTEDVFRTQRLQRTADGTGLEFDTNSPTVSLPVFRPYIKLVSNTKVSNYEFLIPYVLEKLELQLSDIGASYRAPPPQSNAMDLDATDSQEQLVRDVFGNEIKNEQYGGSRELVCRTTRFSRTQMQAHGYAGGHSADLIKAAMAVLQNEELEKMSTHDDTAMHKAIYAHCGGRHPLFEYITGEMLAPIRIPVTQPKMRRRFGDALPANRIFRMLPLHRIKDGQPLTYINHTTTSAVEKLMLEMRKTSQDDNDLSVTYSNTSMFVIRGQDLDYSMAHHQRQRIGCPGFPVRPGYDTAWSKMAIATGPTTYLILSQVAAKERDAPDMWSGDRRAIYPLDDMRYEFEKHLSTIATFENNDFSDVPTINAMLQIDDAVIEADRSGYEGFERMFGIHSTPTVAPASPLSKRPRTSAPSTPVNPRPSKRARNG